MSFDCVSVWGFFKFSNTVFILCGLYGHKLRYCSSVPLADQ